MIRNAFGIRSRLILLTLTAAALFVLVGCGSPGSVGVQSQPANPPQVTQPSNQPQPGQPPDQGEVDVPAESEPPPQPKPPPPAPATQPVPATVEVVVAGYLSHGPMQPTVQAIKEVLDKYGDKVDVTWFDLSTKEGASYFQDNKLSAHLNVIINGKYTYDVNGKPVTFQWFEGQQWTRQDLDAVLTSLLSE